MAGVAILAVISFLGIVAAFAAVVYISVGIKREDRRGGRGGRGGPARISRASQVARQATGFHWA